MEINHRNRTLTHLLGYLTESKWIDTLENYDLNENTIKKLAEQQDKTYDTNLVENLNLE